MRRHPVAQKDRIVGSVFAYVPTAVDLGLVLTVTGEVYATRCRGATRVLGSDERSDPCTAFSIFCIFSERVRLHAI